MKPFDVAIVFAGGKSTRMKEDKALLPFGKYDTLAAFQYAKLQTLFTDVYLSTKEKKFDFEANLIQDCYETYSPLVGLLSVFETLDAQEIFVLSVDAPFVDTDIIRDIMTIDIEKYDAIIAKSPYGIEPLCGRYKRSILPLLQKQYQAQNHRLHTLLHTAKTYMLDFTDTMAFTNLNHPNEYKEALKRLHSMH